MTFTAAKPALDPIPGHLRIDAIQRDPTTDIDAYTLALAYCYLFRGHECWQWQAAPQWNRVRALDLIYDARTLPKYLDEKATGATA